MYQRNAAPYSVKGDESSTPRRVVRTGWAAAMCLLALYLHGCAGVLVAGAVGGASMAADRRTAAVIVDDQAIELKTSKAVHANEELSDKTNISITSYNGVLLLTGQAPTAELRDAVVAAVRPIDKIQRIHNEIEIAEPLPMRVRANDTVVTGRVKSALLAAKGINPMHVKVVTSDGAVYLMGIVTNAEAGFATDIVRRVEGVQRVVRIFEYQD
ncbi:MAG: transporter [Gammaproteobacteria bacterium]|nr:MAG: transporter [Gammaproteobacteria bacterium]TND02700.1 MAG: transporter [Gammaproteobacteria bacterium]